jgi:hypothetical protein
MADYLATQAQQGIPRQNKFPSTSTAWGQLRIHQDPTQLFLDTFDSSLDTTNKWSATSASGGTTPFYSTASTTLTSGGAANGYSLLKTIASFVPQEPGWLVFEARLNIEFPVLATGYRFWGFGNAAAIPVISGPMTDAVGFEISTTGQMYAVTYAAGTRLVIQDLSPSTGNGAQPANPNVHKYYVWFRGDLTFWAIDQADNIVAVFTTGASGPNVNTLPMTYLCVSNGGAPVTIVLNGCSVGDTCRNNMVLSDATFPFRQQKVGASGEVYYDNAQAPYPNAPTNVVAANADTAITAANANRRMLIVSNDSTAKLYLLIDTSGAGAASATNFTYVIAAGATFEMPNPVSTARVRGFWSAANGTAGVTDISTNTTVAGA